MSLLPIILLASTAYGYANPGFCSGICNVHDPAVIRRESDGIYFRFSTGNKISYASASEIEGPWTAIGSMLPSGSSIDIDGYDDLWAPDANFVDGFYYVFYSVSTFGSQESAIGLATSPTMDLYSWTDHGRVGIDSYYGDVYNAIDGNLFLDATKTSGSSSHNIAYDPSGDHAEEGSYLYKYGSYYYLFYSAGICCGYDTSMPASGEEYKIKVCRSTSATKGFVDANGVACTDGGGTIVLESHGTVYGPGGQGVFTDPTLGPVLYYHYVDTTIGYADDQKLFGWNSIDFSTGWPVV
ncbi:endo-alpha-1,5-arabinanase precursor [Talaromyces proteolyticus]|uniref:arabinan endo-1,5-alpha-L-arabinosidase n=1 Tax=Talaromyces proteolyticus TaxID=1131652 RepID=A0AAD4PVT1_9EURO|nr:endo-alpha-1,5-arabinanase precursor [Talaromyces proteolyticus]KAH8691673.1 endo-alpha-1,5-arabinanase precursor [Talaromyces proteolyticus]